ncbi:MAG: hypothetical protein F4X14_15125 [Caldilineaceae bacterium SB0661_bin_32]|uniref:Uncharacterized protein n=1 Tax=Caldilineaceae bacterium SB0661_bin_32 TaxID=2605255 RepID=A0A6B1D9M6_9CHLR|nr:hypothetical protein [Caldilineaceae bacterium SB0661_bin_32]
MGNVTHAQVQELVNSLPETKLSLAFHLLQDLVLKDAEVASQNELPRPARMALGDSSLDELRQLLALQAERMKEHYEQTEEERADWQAGDFSDREIDQALQIDGS